MRRHEPNRPPATREGFTLIEIMAAMAVFAILLFALLRIFAASSASLTKGSQLSKLDTEARLAMDFIADKLESHWVNASISGGGGGFSTAAFHFPIGTCQQAGTLTLASPPAAALPGAHARNAIIYTPHAYSLANGDTVRSEPCVIMDNVLDFEIKFFDVVTSTTTGSGQASWSGCSGSTQRSAALAVVYIEAVPEAVAIQATTGLNPTDRTFRYHRAVHLPLKEFTR